MADGTLRQGLPRSQAMPRLPSQAQAGARWAAGKVTGSILYGGKARVSRRNWEVHCSTDDVLWEADLDHESAELSVDEANESCPCGGKHTIVAAVRETAEPGADKKA